MSDEKWEEKIIVNSPRSAGKNVKALLWFLDEGKKGKSVGILTKVGYFLSPKAVEDKITLAKEERDKEILEFAETVAYCVEVGDERTVVASSDLITFLTK